MIRLDVTFLAESKLNINPPVCQLIIFDSNMIGAVDWSLTSSGSPLNKDTSSFHTETHIDQERLKCDNTLLVVVSAFVHVITMTRFSLQGKYCFPESGFYSSSTEAELCRP